MLVNGIVNLSHPAPGLGKGLNDPAVVFNVVRAERSASAIFQPFLRRLVASDSECVGLVVHTVKVLVGIDPNTPGLSTP